MGRGQGEGLKKRTTPVQTRKTEVQIQGEWFDYELIERLYNNSSSYGFDTEDYVNLEGEEHEQIEELEKRGLAFKGTGGSWYGTKTLVQVIDAADGEF